MALEWLNHYVPVSGQWLPGQPLVLESWNEVAFTQPGGRNLRIHETSRSGSVLLSGAGGPLLGYGDAEVYLTVAYAAGGFEYRSAPLHTPIQVQGVSNLRLSVLVPVGNSACTSVDYTAFVNAHCIFERL